jgi:hypothetical protein
MLAANLSVHIDEVPSEFLLTVVHDIKFCRGISAGHLRAQRCYIEKEKRITDREYQL